MGHAKNRHSHDLTMNCIDNAIGPYAQHPSTFILTLQLFPYERIIPKNIKCIYNAFPLFPL